MRKSEILLRLAETMDVDRLLKLYPSLSREAFVALLREAAKSVGTGIIQPELPLFAAPQKPALTPEPPTIPHAPAGIATPHASAAPSSQPAVKTTGRSLKIYTDGGSRGNPGVSGIGVVIRDESGYIIKRIARYIGTATNNQAEYTALLDGLKAAMAMGAESVEVLADSELMVKQIKGLYKVRHPELQPLYLDAKTMISRLKRFKITHIPRAQNADADALANEAMDKRLS